MIHIMYIDNIINIIKYYFDEIYVERNISMERPNNLEYKLSLLDYLYYTTYIRE